MKGLFLFILFSVPAMATPHRGPDFGLDKTVYERNSAEYVESIDPNRKPSNYVKNGKMGPYEISINDLYSIGISNFSGDVDDDGISLLNNVPFSENQFHIKNWNDLKNNTNAQMFFKECILSKKLEDYPELQINNNMKLIKKIDNNN